MKNNLLIIVSVIVIILGGWWVFTLFQNERLEMSGDPLSDFQVKDTASVDKIVITEKDLATITLNRNKEDKKWYINNTDQLAIPYNVNLILETAFQIQVKQNVDSTLQQTAINILSVRHKKIEFYQNGESHAYKSWYVGNPTSDHSGTFMLLEVYDKSTNSIKRSPEAFITHKPGVIGTLDTRIFANINDWMHPGVFNYEVKNISKIEVLHHEKSEESFGVEVLPSGKVSLEDAKGLKIAPFDSNEVKHYVTHYKELFYESIVKELTASQKDSIFASQPQFTFSVTDIKGKKKSVQLWKIKNNNTEVRLDAQMFDTGRAYIRIDNSSEIMTIQFFTWDVLFKPLSYFVKK